MQILAISILAFFGAFALGSAKYFALGHLIAINTSSPAWVAQILGAIMTLGPVLIFPWVIPMGNKYPRRTILATTLITSSLLCLTGVWVESNLWVWIQLFGIGVSMGVFGMIRTSLAPEIAQQSNKSLTLLNGCLSVLFIVGLISGLIFGRHSHETQNYFNWIGLSLLFLFPLPLIKFLNFKVANNAKASMSWIPSMTKSLHLVQKRGSHVLSSACIWGIASSLTLAVTLHLETQAIATPITAVLMSAFAAVGGIIGNLISSRFHKFPEPIAATSSFIFSLSLLLWIPILTNTPHSEDHANQLYNLSSLLMTFQGLLFGLTTNLLDSKFLKLCYEDNLEVEGASFQSSAISFFCFFLGSLGGVLLLLNYISPLQQYLALSGITFLATLSIVKISLSNAFLQTKLLSLSAFTIRQLLKLRYSWNSISFPKKDNPKTGTLILPNHPAEIDPVLLQSLLWKDYHPRPVMDEGFYKMKWLNPIMKTLGTFPIIDLSKQPGTYAQTQILEQVQAIADALNKGDNVLFYPSGQLKRSSNESLGSKSGLYKLLQLVPEVNLLLIDNKGLWGSRFSTLPHSGVSPDLFQQFKSSIKDLLLNLIFFMPKRNLTLRVEKGSPALKNGQTAKELNLNLEAWYNHPHLDKETFTKPIFWLPQKSHTTSSQTSETQQTLTFTEKDEPLLNLIAEVCETERNQLTPNTDFSHDLELDSLAQMELFVNLETDLNMTLQQPEKIKTISDLINNMSDNSNASTTNHFSWPKETSNHSLKIESKNHLGLAFLKKCDQTQHQKAILADGQNGSLNSIKFKQCIYAITQVLKNDSSPIGICLPASSLAGAGLIAASLTQRLAVPLNWTTGNRAWNHAIETSGLTSIFTSRKFLEKANLPLDSQSNIKWIIWEDILESLTLGEKLDLVYQSKKKAELWEEQFNLSNVSKDTPAILLFTSGSESLPKGVPLTHHNLLTNLNACLDRINFKETDILMGFLPPFHAFGLTVTTLLPLLTGLRVVYSPNPTDTKALVRHIKSWTPSLICGTPTFFKHLLMASKENELTSINTFVSGAEACPDTLKDELKTISSDVSIFEGYGMTEASPVLCLQDSSDSIGVGKPVTGVELKIVHPETHQVLKSGESGLILARGDNFFSGYLNSDKNPFLAIENQLWYDTGDLGKIDPSGSLILEGRLSRFIKVGGEMISLPAIEKALIHHFSDEVQLALIPKEVEGQRPTLTLFSNTELETQTINKTLKEAGFSSLSRIHQCRNIDKIPTLGTGKTDFNKLKELLLADAS